MIFILDRNEEIIGLLKNGGNSQGTPPYFDDLLTEDLATGAETFQFSTIIDGDISASLVVGNYVAFQKDGHYKLFQIMRTEEDHQEAMYITIYCECAGLELINSVVRSQSLYSATFDRFLSIALDDTSWEVGQMPYYTDPLDIELEDSTAYEAIQNYIGQYGVEISFRVEIKNGRITGKYVDAFETRGSNTGKRFEFGRDVDGLVRTTDISELYTALIGKGNNDIDFRDVSISGIDKPKGQDFVADEESFQRYNNGGYHVIGIYEVETDSPEELLRQTYNQLQKVKEPKIEYEVSVALLGHLLGEEWNEVGIGDTVYVVDNFFNPPVHLSARVKKLETSMTDPQSDKCTLGNFIEVKSNLNDAITAMKSKLQGYVNSKFPIKGTDISEGAVSSSHIYQNSITTEHLSAQAITADKIKAGEIDTKHLKANSIDTKNIKAGAITSDKISTGQIKSEHIETGTLNADVINAETMYADLIKGIVVEALNLYAGEADIDKAQIDSALIDSAEISKLVAKDIVVGNAQITDLEAEKINAGNIDADRIKANVIDAININSTSATIDSAKIGELTADKIKASVISAINLYANSAVIDKAQIDSAAIKNIEAEKIIGKEIDTDILKANIIQAVNASIGTATIDAAKIGKISADKIEGGEISAEVLKANIITAINASMEMISADRIDVKNLKVDKIDAENIVGGNIDSDRLQANVINAINSYTGTAKIKQGQIDTLQVGTANITELDVSKIKVTGKLSADNIDVGNISVDEGNIKNLDASKITSGTLDAGKVSISSTSGNLTLQDNTIQILDNQDVQQIRVQIGEDKRGQYGILVFNQYGTPIFDSDKGVLSSDGLTDDIISNEKLKDNSINSRTLNLEELFVSDSAFINSLQAVKIKASNIEVDTIRNDLIDIEGLVTFESFADNMKDIFIKPTYDLDEDGNKVYGKTYINGGQIATGTLSADQIDILGKLTVNGADGLPTFAIKEDGNIEVNGLLKSSNFDEEKATGYKIGTDGKAILNEATVRGSVILPHAGITDEGSNGDSIRFWAGDSFENRDVAPFKVTQDGDVFAKNTTLSGILAGEVQNGNLHIKDSILEINGINSFMNDEGRIVSYAQKNETTSIKLSAEEAVFNTNVIIGDLENSGIEYSNENSKMAIKDINLDIISSGTTNLSVDNTNDVYSGITMTSNGENVDGKVTFGFRGFKGAETSVNEDWKNTFMITSRGAKALGEHGDICLSREKELDENGNYIDSGDIDVRIDGNIHLKNSVKSTKSEIEIRTTSDGWGFYTT